MIRKLIFAALFLLFGYAGFAQQLTAGLDSLIGARLKDVAPGCAILVAKNGKIVYKKGFGMADIELNVPMQADMVFRLGSTTKQYTAIAILQLVEQGKISLQDSIQKFIKDFPNKGHTITIENLLTHTSGIIDYQALDTKASRENFYYRKDYNPKEIIDFFKDEPLAFVPGSKFGYSNSNYFLLGYIIELVSGENYKDYMQKHIFDAAGLSHTYYGGYKDIIPNRVNGYARYNGKYENADYLSMTIPYAAGALASNVEDMFKWHQALYAYQLVKKELLDKAFTPFKLADGSFSNYGYGWFIKYLQGSKTIEHSGGVDGFQSDEVHFPKEDVFVAMLYNSMNEGGDDLSFMYLSNDIATLAIGKHLAADLKIDNSVLQQYTGEYAMDATHTATISLDNNQLQIESKSGGLPKSPLFAETTGKFLLKVVSAEVEFTKDATGNITGLVVHVNGQDQVCKKIK
jgi:CubicO group peptidase (beta-lactamase class C family)